MDSALKFATQLAMDTGQLLLEYFNPNGTHSNLKEDFSVVTEADLSADQMITEAIRKNYPNDGLISEELQPEIGSANSAVWVVDPLDGTTNFSLGLPIWGVSIARVVDGWPEIGVAHFPFLDELYSASRGAGAFMNGDQIHSKPPEPGKPTHFSPAARAPTAIMMSPFAIKPASLDQLATLYVQLPRVWPWWDLKPRQKFGISRPAG